MPPTGPNIPFPKAPTCGVCSLAYHFHTMDCRVGKGAKFTKAERPERPLSDRGR